MKTRLITNARALRRNQTFAEDKLWHILRNSRLGGYKFRRQVPIDHYIADFCCFTVKVIVELDGDSHCERLAYDRERDDYLMVQGFFVLRYENCVVMREENRVLEEIIFVCKSRVKDIPLTPNPSPAEGEGNNAKKTKTPKQPPASGEVDKSKIPLTPLPPRERGTKP